MGAFRLESEIILAANINGSLERGPVSRNLYHMEEWSWDDYYLFRSEARAMKKAGDSYALLGGHGPLFR